MVKPPPQPEYVVVKELKIYILSKNKDVFLCLFLFAVLSQLKCTNTDVFVEEQTGTRSGLVHSSTFGKGTKNMFVSE